MPENLPNDPKLLKQMLAKMQSRVGFLEEQLPCCDSDCLADNPSKQSILRRRKWCRSTRQNTK